MQVLELNHVALHVQSVTASVHFYSKILEFEQLNRPAFDFDGAWFRLGTQQELHILEGRNYQVQSGSRMGHFAVKVASVSNVRHFLESKGVLFKGPKQRPDGVYQIFVEDPDGHFIEFSGNL